MPRTASRPTAATWPTPSCSARTLVGTAQFLGNLNRPYCAMYSYAEQESFEGGPQELVAMLPRDCVLVGSSAGGGRTAYGAISQMEDRGDVITVRGERMVSLTLNEPEEQKRMFRLASRPCLIPSDIESLSAIRDLAEEWLERKYPGLTEVQRLALCRAIFEEVLRDMRRAIPDVVEGVLERYGLVSPSRRAKPIAPTLILTGPRG